MSTGLSFTSAQARLDRLDLGSAASDRCSEESYGMGGAIPSFGSIGGDAERSKTLNGKGDMDRTSKLVQLRQRQSKVVQALKRRTTEGSGQGDSPRNSNDIMRQFSGLSDVNQANLTEGGLTARTLSRQCTTTSLDGGQSESARVMTVQEMPRVLLEIRDAQETLHEKLLAVAASTDERSQETTNLLAELSKGVDAQGHEILDRRAADHEQATAALKSLSERLEGLLSQEAAQRQELQETRGEGAKAAQENLKLLGGVSEELQAQAATLKALQQASKDTATQLREELHAQDPRGQIGELSKETTRLLADLGRSVESQGRQVESLRSQEVPERVSELQRGVEALQRGVEALRTSEAQHTAEVQRSLETTSQSLQSLRAQDTGQHLLDLQRLLETQARSLESGRAQDAGQLTELRRALEAQGTQLAEAVRSQDPAQRLSDLRKSTEALAELMQEMKPKVQETSAGLGYITTAMATHSTGLQDLTSQAVARHQAMAQSLTDLRVSVDALVKPATVEELSAKVAEIQQALVHQEKRGDQRDVSLEAAFEETVAGVKAIKDTFDGFSRSSSQHHQGVSSAISELRSTIEASGAQTVAQQQEAARGLLETVTSSAEAQSSGFRDACHQVTSSTLEALSSMQRRLEDTDGGLQTLHGTVSSQSGQLEQLLSQVAAQQQAAQAHTRELQELRRGLAEEAAIQGMRRELDASKNRQETLEAELVAKTKVWEEERQILEKEVARLRAREATLVQQLQQAIVPIPAEVPAPQPKKEGKFGFSAYFQQGRLRGKAVGLGLLAAVLCFVVGIVLTLWPVVPPPEPPSHSFGFLRHGPAFTGPSQALWHLRGPSSRVSARALRAKRYAR